MGKSAKNINLNLPLVRVMIRKRVRFSKFGTHAGKIGRVINFHLWNVTLFPKRHVRTPSLDLRVS